MYNLHTEMPMGNQSIGFNFPDRDKAVMEFERVCVQVAGWTDYTIDIVLSEDGLDYRREHFDAKR